MTSAKNIFIFAFILVALSSCENWRHQNFYHRKYLHLKKLEPKKTDELKTEVFKDYSCIIQVDSVNHALSNICDTVLSNGVLNDADFANKNLSQIESPVFIMEDLTCVEEVIAQNVSCEKKVAENPPDIPTNTKRVFFFTGGGLAAFVFSVMSFFLWVPLWLLFVIACVLLLTWGWVLSFLTIIQGNELSSSEKTNNIKWNLAYCWFVFVTGCLFYLLIITLFIEKRIEDRKKKKYPPTGVPPQ